MLIAVVFSAFCLMAALVSGFFVPLAKIDDARFEASEPLPMSLSCVVPVYGKRKGLKEIIGRLISELEAYGGAAELILSLQDPDDEALPVLRQLAARHADIPIRILVHPVLPDLTGKSSNVIYGLKAATGDLLLLCDADVTWPEQALSHFLAPLGDGRSVTTAIVRHIHPDSIWARLYALAMNLVFFGSFLPNLWFGRADAVAGGAIGLPRAAMAEIGGMEAAGAYIAEDVMLGRLLVREGYIIRIGGRFDSTVGSLSLRQWLDTMGRGMMIVQTMTTPWQRVLGLAAFSFESISLLGFILSGSYLPLLVGILGWALAALGITRLYRHYQIGNGLIESVWLPIFHLVGFVLFWIKAIFPFVTWAGQTYRIGHGGHIQRH